MGGGIGNDYGQLGDGTTTDQNNSVQVTNVDGSRLSGVVGISAGYDHTVYLKAMARCGRRERMNGSLRRRYNHESYKSRAGSECGWED